MFTKNWDVISIGLGSGGNITLKTINNTTYPISTGNSYNMTVSGTNFGICFGDGNTIAPTNEDYNLENEISSLTVVAAQNNGSNAMTWDLVSNFKYTISKTVRNDTNSTILIKEYGIKSYMDASRIFLILREVLDTPISIEPNETKTFTITIDK